MHRRFWNILSVIYFRTVLIYACTSGACVVSTAEEVVICIPEPDVKIPTNRGDPKTNSSFSKSDADKMHPSSDGDINIDDGHDLGESSGLCDGS